METKGPQLIFCEDGSHTIFLPELNETYHSTRGAIPESIHVYIREGFEKALKPDEVIQVLEIGYGTGLNALLTLMSAEARKQETVYHSLEPFPLPATIWKQLNYGTLLSKEEEWELLNSAAWEQSEEISPCLQLYKEKTTLEEVDLPEDTYDMVYFDGFAPRKQAELWNTTNLAKLYKAMKAGGKLVTYTAKAQLRRDLRTVGFEAGLVKGPPGKKEMTVAVKK